MTTRTKTAAAAAAAFGLLALASPAFAQGFGGGFTEQSGAEIYGAICQGCHMPHGKGAKGAAMMGYPALAGNKKLAAKAYPALVITRGQKAMPEFGSTLSDQQVANVINFIRTNFGNTYTDAITPEQVKAMRPVKAATGAVRAPG